MISTVVYFVFFASSHEGHPSYPSTLKNRAFVKHRSEISNSACTDPKIVLDLRREPDIREQRDLEGWQVVRPSSHYATLESQPVPLGGPAGSLFQKLPCFLLSQKARELSQCVDTVRSAPWILPSHVSLTVNTTSHVTCVCSVLGIGIKKPSDGYNLYYSYITLYYKKFNWILCEILK